MKNERVPNITSKITIDAGTRRRTIALLLPTLNELQGLKATIPFIDRSLVDTTSSSSTGGPATARSSMRSPWASRWPASCDRAFISRSSTSAAIYLHDYLIEFSPDGNCKPEQLPELVAKIHEGYDHVVVSRYLGHAFSEDDHVITAFGNWMFSRLMRPLARFSITDALNIYRGYRRDFLLDRTSNST